MQCKPRTRGKCSFQIHFPISWSCSWGMGFDPPTWSHMKSQLISFFFLPLNSRVFPVAAIDTCPAGLEKGRWVLCHVCWDFMLLPQTGQMILGDVEQQETGCTGLYLVLSFFTSRLMFWAGPCRKTHHWQRLSVTKRN